MEQKTSGRGHVFYKSDACSVCPICYFYFWRKDPEYVLFRVMEQQFKKVISAFALTTMILVSLVSVCRQMQMTCGWDCSHQTIRAMHMETQTVPCAQNNTSCSVSIQDHMTSFSNRYPSIATDAVSLAFISTTFILLAWLLFSKRDISFVNEERKAQLRSLRGRLSKSVTPEFLIFAYSRGILNSKMYA